MLRLPGDALRPSPVTVRPAFAGGFGVAFAADGGSPVFEPLPPRCLDRPAMINPLKFEPVERQVRSS